MCGLTQGFHNGFHNKACMFCMHEMSFPSIIVGVNGECVFVVGCVSL